MPSSTCCRLSARIVGPSHAPHAVVEPLRSRRVECSTESSRDCDGSGGGESQAIRRAYPPRIKIIAAAVLLACSKAWMARPMGAVVRLPAHWCWEALRNLTMASSRTCATRTGAKLLHAPRIDPPFRN